MRNSKCGEALRVECEGWAAKSLQGNPPNDAHDLNIAYFFRL